MSGRREAWGRALRVLVIAVLLLAAPAAANAASVKLSPSSGLGDHQYVKVDWSGFAPSSLVYFRQCTASPTDIATQCTKLYADVGYSDSGGSGTLYEFASLGDVTAEGGGTFRCDSSHPCSIGVFTAPSLDSGATRKVEFAKTPSECPKPKGDPISGGGSDLANHTVYDWGIDLCSDSSRLGVSYVPANATDGRANFVNGLNDFAVTSSPFTKEEQAKLDASKRTVTYAPLTASGLVLAYKVFDQDTARANPGAQVTDLKLTPDDVARIFTGTVPNWNNDASIVSNNPGHQFPPTIRPLVRGDHSDATTLFTSWLTAAATKGTLPKDWPGTTENYPLGYLTQDGAIVGGDKLAQAIADPATSSLNNDFFNTGFIGYVDSSQAAYYGLPTVRLQNAAGKFVAATPESVAAAIAVAGTDKVTGLIEPVFDDVTPGMYPLPVVTYATVPDTAKKPGTLTTLRSFLAWVAATGQKQLPAGAVPLPKAMLAKTTAASKPPAKTADDGESSGDGDGSSTSGSGASTSGTGSSSGGYGGTYDSSSSTTTDVDVEGAAGAAAAAGESKDGADGDCTGECDGSDDGGVLDALPAARLHGSRGVLTMGGMAILAVIAAVIGLGGELGRGRTEWLTRIPWIGPKLRRTA